MTEFWQDIITGFGIGFTAYAATNLDNMLLVGGLLAGGVQRRSVTAGFVIAGTLVMLLASSFTILSFLLPQALLGYFGIIPIVLGLRLLVLHAAETDSTVRAGAGAVSVATLLAANSLDTVVTFAPMFTESEWVARFALAVGFIASAVILFFVVLRFARRLSTFAGGEAIAQRIAAAMMILVGIYVLADTGTDLV